MIQIETLRSAFKVPVRFQKESIDLKEAIFKANNSEIFRTPFIKHFIDSDWEHFAYKLSVIDFLLYAG